jgi:hypothetical protein
VVACLHEGPPADACPQDPAQQQELVKALHLLKTDIFMEMVESGAMPLRPGVARLVEEAMAAGGCAQHSRGVGQPWGVDLAALPCSSIALCW